jgi:hypothetical protein
LPSETQTAEVELRIATLSILLAATLAGACANAGVTLRNALWTIELQPETLAIKATPAQRPIPAPETLPDGDSNGGAAERYPHEEIGGKESVEVSRGASTRQTHDLHTTETDAAWQWDQGRYRLTARLDGADLILSIHASDSGKLAILRQPAAAMGRALALSMAEGHYVPAGDARWREFLLRDMSIFDTSQDLSLPLWTLDHGAYTLSWIIENPYNNTAGFTREGDGLALSLDHVFTPLDQDTPMTLVLHLGGPDPLAGATRYRAWLTAHGDYRPLSGKIADAPLGARLLGATHIYLWGGGLLATKDVTDWPALLARLNGKASLAARLRAHMDKDALDTVRGAAGHAGPTRRQAVIRAVNDAFDALARAGWQTATPDMRVLTTRYAELRQEAARAFDGALSAEPARWGAGVSVDTMDTLSRAGLERLWIGLGQGWEGGLWHPEAIGAGVRAGYLLAPYDSYETALPPGRQPSWATAQLGAAAYRDCAITRQDGSMQPGFQGAGRYTDPACVRPLLQARARAILQAVPFNSWFLDVYATGMAFDNYASTGRMSQARYVRESADSLRWITATLHLPAGSEGGNAASRDILFAHGMQTPVIGWGDRDMNDARSPYFTGAWYPDDQPAKFFKPVPLKDAYRAIHFDPTTRLPLYQTVYHGAVITTHHWLFDNLKLSNVHVENTLAQLLYNVPALFHLSSTTLARRLPEIVRQDAFFRPLHERLAGQALVGFEWLTADRRVQRTVFEDGTSLVANFRDTDYTWRGTSITGASIAVFAPGRGAPIVYRVEQDPIHDRAL